MSFGVNITGVLAKAIDIDHASIRHFGTTCVIAPHPDDESLGCGGLISLLRSMGLRVLVVFVTDGSFSHPLSVEFPKTALRDLREQEAIAALDILGVDRSNIWFMRLGDGQMPGDGTPAYTIAFNEIARFLGDIQPSTVVLPFRNDPHRDHLATYKLFTACIVSLNFAVRILEYPIWLWHRGSIQDIAMNSEFSAYRINVSGFLDQKNLAIGSHRSQLGEIITDDPSGFVLSREMIDYFLGPFELFFSSVNVSLP